MPTIDGGDDAIWVGGPDEGLGVVIVLLEEAFDRGLEVDDRMEDAAFQPALGELGEETLDRIEPGARGRREMEDETRVTRQPGHDFGVLVGGIVVENDMDHLAGRHPRLDGIEKADELLMAVSLHTLPDDLAFEHVESGKQGRGAVALIVVGERAAAPGLHRQIPAGCGPALGSAISHRPKARWHGPADQRRAQRYPAACRQTADRATA